MLSLTIDDKKQILTKFEVDREKRDVRLRTSGFFASKTVGLDLDPLQAMDNYGMRDEQEKCFQLQKGAARTGSHSLLVGVRQAWQDVHMLRRPHPCLVCQIGMGIQRLPA